MSDDLAIYLYKSFLSFLTYMGNLCLSAGARTHVTPDGALEDFEHEGEQGASQCSVPAPLGRFIANKGVLGLDFEEL